MADEFFRAVANCVIGQLCDGTNFKAVQKSSLEALTDVLMKYIEEIGQVAHAYTEHAGRTESNIHDILLAFGDIGISVSELTGYLKATQDVPFKHIVPTPSISSLPRIPSFKENDEKPPKDYIPDWLPAFPDAHTIENIAVWPEKQSTEKSDRLELDDERRKTEASLVSLHQKLKFAMTGASSEEVRVSDSGSPRRGIKRALWGQEGGVANNETKKTSNLSFERQKLVLESGELAEVLGTQDSKGKGNDDIDDELGVKVLESFSDFLPSNKKMKKDAFIEENNYWSGWKAHSHVPPKVGKEISFNWNIQSNKDPLNVQKFFSVGGSSLNSLSERRRKEASKIKGSNAEEKNEIQKRCQEILQNVGKITDDEEKSNKVEDTAEGGL